jgi:fumarate reductase flavoprotein subunit
MTLPNPDQAEFDVSVDVVIVGGGGCGLSAALAAHQAGAEVLVLERDTATLGTTAMSTGLIPAAGSRFQRAAGIDDTPSQFANDMLAKAKGKTDLDIVAALAVESAATVDWLADCGVPLSLVDSFLYPGHTAMRMHGTPNRTGSELMGSLSQAIARADIGVLTQATVTDLFADHEGRVHGARCRRPDGSFEDVGCKAAVLACCGFAGNPEMLAEYIPEILGAEFFGHPGNKGDAIRWGRELGAEIADIHSYQGHGGLAAGHGIPILWPVIMEGGFQVNAEGKRFSNESKGYSEQAVEVVAQPGHVAWTLYDERLHQLMQEFDDYRDAMAAKAIRSATTVSELAETLGLPADEVQATFAEVAHATNTGDPDCFGRKFAKRATLSTPFYGVKVTGALFHTQGGLVVDRCGRVQRQDGTPLPNLFAGGGAARGVSGPSRWGYLAGNGLLTATTFGRLAGTAAANLAQEPS